MPPTELPGAGWSRSVVGFLLAVFSSAAATMAGITALGIQVFAVSGRELDLGILGLVEFLPAAVLVLLTGAVADRYDRRRVGALAFIGEAVAAIGLAVYAGTGSNRLGPVYLLVLAFGAARAFGTPAVRSLPADIVDAAAVPWLIPRFAIAWQTAAVAGPVLGGVLAAVARPAPYIAMAVLLSVAAVAIGSVRLAGGGSEPETRVAPPSASRLREAVEGLRFIRSHPILLGAVSLDLFAVLFGGALALLPALAEDRLGVGAIGLGWLRAAVGIGAGLTTLVLVRLPVRRSIGRVLLSVVAVFGLATIVLGITRNYAVAFGAVLIGAGADAISVYIRATLVPLATPTAVRGRVVAVENVFIGASNELGAFESGVAGQWLGAPAAVVLGGVATMVVAGAWWFGFPALRDVDEFPIAADAGPE